MRGLLGAEVRAPAGVLECCEWNSDTGAGDFCKLRWMVISTGERQSETEKWAGWLFGDSMTSPAEILRLPSQGSPSEAALDPAAGPVVGKSRFGGCQASRSHL